MGIANKLLVVTCLLGIVGVQAEPEVIAPEAPKVTNTSALRKLTNRFTPEGRQIRKLKNENRRSNEKMIENIAAINERALKAKNKLDNTNGDKDFRERLIDGNTVLARQKVANNIRAGQAGRSVQIDGLKKSLDEKAKRSMARGIANKFRSKKNKKAYFQDDNDNLIAEQENKIQNIQSDVIELHEKNYSLQESEAKKFENKVHRQNDKDGIKAEDQNLYALNKQRNNLQFVIDMESKLNNEGKIDKNRLSYFEAQMKKNTEAIEDSNAWREAHVQSSKKLKKNIKKQNVYIKENKDVPKKLRKKESELDEAKKQLKKHEKQQSFRRKMKRKWLKHQKRLKTNKQASLK